MAEPTAWLRVLGEIFYRHWGAKIAAFILAAILFVVTRDEVTRTFDVPVQVVDDPTRVLLTSLPERIQVQIRGPWTRVNRLQDTNFEPIELKLHDLKEGPLEIESAAIRMPPGVVLAKVDYKKVDLRFDRVVLTPVAVSAPVQGKPAEDYELVRVEVQPLQWNIRGGESVVAQVDKLLTAPLEITGATEDVSRPKTILPPPAGVTLVPGGDAATVNVRAIVKAKTGTRPYAVPVIVPAGVDPTGVIPRTYPVTLRGPLPDFRTLERLSVTSPVQANARVVANADGGISTVEVTFSWADEVPQDARLRLTYDHPTVRIEVPAPPNPIPPSGDAPAPER